MTTPARPRGAGWVAAQFFLMSAVLALGPVTPGAWGGSTVIVTGAVLILVGAGVGIRGTLDLGRNRTAYPAPKTDGKLVTHGIYAWIRHPLYTALVLIALGWGLCWCSWLALTCGVLLAVLLERKARVEERGMTERYSGYAEYARRVKRFLPGVY